MIFVNKKSEKNTNIDFLLIHPYSYRDSSRNAWPENPARTWAQNGFKVGSKEPISGPSKHTFEKSHAKMLPKFQNWQHWQHTWQHNKPRKHAGLKAMLPMLPIFSIIFIYTRACAHAHIQVLKKVATCPFWQHRTANPHKHCLSCVAKNVATFLNWQHLKFPACDKNPKTRINTGFPDMLPSASIWMIKDIFKKFWQHMTCVS